MKLPLLFRRARASLAPRAITLETVTELAPQTPTATLTYLVAGSTTYQLVNPSASTSMPPVSPSAPAANPKNGAAPSSSSAGGSASDGGGSVFGTGNGNGGTKIVVPPPVATTDVVSTATTVVTVTHVATPTTISNSAPSNTSTNNPPAATTQPSVQSSDSESIFHSSGEHTAVVMQPSDSAASSNNIITIVITPVTTVPTNAAVTTTSVANAGSNTSLPPNSTPVTNPKNPTSTGSAATPIVSDTSSSSSSSSNSSPVASTSQATNLSSSSSNPHSTSITSPPNPSSTSSATSTTASSTTTSGDHRGWFQKIGDAPASIVLTTLVCLGILAVLLGIAACIYRRCSPRRRRERDEAALISNQDEIEWEEDTLERHERRAGMAGWRDPFGPNDGDNVSEDSAAAVLPINVWARRQLARVAPTPRVERSPREMSERERPSSEWTSFIGDDEKQQAREAEEADLRTARREYRVPSIVGQQTTPAGQLQHQPSLLGQSSIEARKFARSNLRIMQTIPASPYDGYASASPAQDHYTSPPIPNLRRQSVRARYGEFQSPVQPTPNGGGQHSWNVAMTQGPGGQIYTPRVDSDPSRYGSQDSLSVMASPVFASIPPPASRNFLDPPIQPIRPLFSPTPSMPPRKMAHRNPPLSINIPPRSESSFSGASSGEWSTRDAYEAGSDGGSSTVLPSPARTVRPMQRNSLPPPVPPLPASLQVTPGSPIRHAFFASAPPTRPSLVHLHTTSTSGGLTTSSDESSEEAVVGPVETAETRRFAEENARRASVVSIRNLMVERRRRSEGEIMTRRRSSANIAAV